MQFVIVEGDINCDSDNTSVLSGIICERKDLILAFQKLEAFLFEKFEMSFPDQSVELTICLSHLSKEEALLNWHDDEIKLEFVLNNGESAGIFEFSHHEISPLSIIHLSSNMVSNV